MKKHDSALMRCWYKAIPLSVVIVTSCTILVARGVVSFTLPTDHQTPSKDNSYGCRYNTAIAPPTRHTIARICKLRLLLSNNGVDVPNDDTAVAVIPFVQTDTVIRQTSKALKRASWFSWWSQVILTTISGVILVFAKSVPVGRQSFTEQSSPSFLLSGAGILLSSLSIVWTWGNGARLSRRLTIKPTTRAAAAHMLRRAIRVGVTINLAGLLCNLVAAEEIIGSLAIKVLTSNRSIFASGGAGLIAPEGLQPLDVLVVQANTNSLLSQFCSLVSLLYLTKHVHRLDPPSTEEEARW